MENTFSMKDTVIHAFFLPTHVLFQNRPGVSEGADARALIFPAAFNKDTFHTTVEITSRCMSVYLIGFTGEFTATKLTLDLALRAVVLQVVGQVAARQLHRTAIGAGDHIEGAGGEVALKRDATGHQTHPIRWGWEQERAAGISCFLPAAASSGPSSGSPPHCECIGWAEPGSAAPAPGPGRSEEEKQAEVSAAGPGMCSTPVCM